jgi:hypothetical protein
MFRLAVGKTDMIRDNLFNSMSSRVKVTQIIYSNFDNDTTQNRIVGFEGQEDRGVEFVGGRMKRIRVALMSTINQKNNLEVETREEKSYSIR